MISMWHLVKKKKDCTEVQVNASLYYRAVTCPNIGNYAQKSHEGDYQLSKVSPEFPPSIPKKGNVCSIWSLTNMDRYCYSRLAYFTNKKSKIC